MSREDFYIGSEFDVNKVKLDNVNTAFKKDYIDYYNNSMKLLKSDDALRKANGLNRINILRKMSFKMNEYNDNSDFQSSYYGILKDSEPFTET